jgi:hypothetical protein
LAADIAGEFRREKDDDLGDLVRFSHATEWGTTAERQAVR